MLELNVCIKDLRDYIEPYYIKSEYNYVEGAEYEEIIICCEEGQYLSNFEAINRAVELA